MTTVNVKHEGPGKYVVQRGETPPANDDGPPVLGIKHDDEKPRWDLLPLEPVARIVDVLTHGATKYQPNNWMQVFNAGDRYFGAAMRHLVAWKGGEKIDQESGLPHLAHATCSLLFLMWFDRNEENNK